MRISACGGMGAGSFFFQREHAECCQRQHLLWQMAGLQQVQVVVAYKINGHR